MINPSELRIGNLVEYNGNIIDVFAISGRGINDTVINYEEVAIPFEDIKPVTLTGEKLLEFGFEQDAQRKQFYSKFDDLGYYELLVEFYLADNGFYLSITADGECVNLPLVKFVHRLQNLYFELTDKELTKK